MGISSSKEKSCRRPFGLCRSQACVLQAVGMLSIDRKRIGLEQAAQAKGMVDLVQMVHPVVVTDDLAQPRTAAAYQAIIVVVFLECQRERAGQQVAHVEGVGQRAGATP